MEEPVDHVPLAQPSVRVDAPADDAPLAQPSARVDAPADDAPLAQPSALGEPEPAPGRTALADRPLPPTPRRARIAALPPQAPKPRRGGRRLLALLAFLAVGAALYVVAATFQPLHADEAGTGVAVRIPPGSDAGAIGKLLEAKGIVASARFFELNATLTLRRGDLRDGSYVLRRSMSNGQAIDALMQGPKVRVVKTFGVTIPEGLSRREAAGAVDASGVEGSYLRATGAKRTLRRVRELGAPRGTRTAEGFLFPATYELAAGAGANDLVAKQLDAFEESIAQVSLARAKRRNLTRYDVLTIASLVERETAVDRERPIVASVIYNRLRDGIPLGIDATIRYVERNWSRPLRESELARDTPFNTRLHRGLPPTPIGSPGLASLKAAAAPARTDYRFYVAKPGTCGHAFSSTDAQFQRDVAKYEAARRANGGRSPTEC